jgi:hypothetical protein
MSTRAAIIVGPTDIVGVVVRGGATTSHHLQWCDDSERLAETVERLLEEMKLDGRATVRAALGPTFCQTRLLRGLAGVRRARSAEALVRNQAATWFRNGETGRTAARPSPDGIWAECFDGPALNAIEAACARRACRLALVVSVPTAMASEVSTGDFEWREGPILLRGECRDRRLTALQRTVGQSGDDSSPDAPTGVDGLDSAEQPQLAAARGALKLSRHARPVLAITAGSDQKVPPQRIAIAAAALLISVTTALVVPVATLRSTTARIATELALHRASASRATATRDSLALLARTSDVVREFRNGRTVWLRVLADLTDVLPPDAAIARIESDGQTICMVAVSTRFLDVVAAIEATPFFTPPALEGQIAQERFGDVTLERASIRFALRPDRP